MRNVPELFSLRDRVAVITGASKGIGRACALAFAQAGADVVLAARTRADLEEVAGAIRQLGRRALVVVVDTLREEDLDRLVAEATGEFGRIDILVNNVGGGGPNDPFDTSKEQFEQLLCWNVTPALLLTTRAAPAMRAAGGGSVINISSVAARFAQKNFTAYGAAKAALNQLSRNLAHDLAPAIRVNVIEPGPILTDALAGYLEQVPEQRQRMLDVTPLGRLGQPEDIAAAALFFASDASSWITGKILSVEGGAEYLDG